MPREMLEAARLYAQMGLAVIPLIPGDKKPILDNWQNIASTDVSVIEKWFKQNPDANLGIATGIKSNVFVVDIDPRHDGHKSWEMELDSHPGKIETWEDLTGGGGRHIWFRHPAFNVRNAVGIFPGVDIRGNGGYVVAPPSIHPDTKQRYEWDGCDPIDKQVISDAPIWLLEILERKEKGTNKKRISIPARIPHGVQYHTLLSLAGIMRNIGLSDEDMLPTLMHVHDHHCEKPGPKKNIENLARNMMKYNPGEKEIFGIATKLWKLTRGLEQQRNEQLSALKCTDAYSLLKQPPKDVRLIIEDCLHVGCTILAGPPKVGKSYLTLGMAIAVATGGKFIGARDIMRPGRVGYWALEESETRTAKRLRQLVETADISLQNLDFMYSLKPMFSGGLEELSLYCETFSPDMIVIDTLMAFVSGDNKSNRKDVFRSDYAEIKKLSELAARYDVAVVVVHHTNKVGGSGIEAVAGTHGVTAAADCIWTMQRQPQRRAELVMTGREVEDQAFLIELDLSHFAGWSVIEEGDDVVLSEERQCILDVLREGTKTPAQLSREIGKSGLATRQLLFKMAQKNQIIRQENGSYKVYGSSKSSYYEHDAD